MLARTPTPWEVNGPDELGAIEFTEVSGPHANGRGTVSVAWCVDDSQAVRDDNAAFIVRAVNAFEANEALIKELVEALNGLRGFMPPSGDCRIDAVLEAADAVVAKAEAR